MTPRAPRICCLDLDTFFVSVERLLDPSLEGKPVVVGGSNGRGVVTACSYEVRRFGVRSGMPMAEARRLAPGAIYLPTRHNTYSPYAKRVREILERFTPVVQTASIDEFFLDFAGCDRLYADRRCPGADAAIENAVRRMCRAIRKEVGLPASAGIGTSRTIAKIASGQAKPAGVRLVVAGGERGFVEHLDIRRYPGIGPRTEERLRAVGIDTIGDLLHLQAGPLRARFGTLSDRIARTLDGATGNLGADRPAFLEHDAPHTLVGSMSNERTFQADVGDRAAVVAQLRSLAERVCWRARRRQARARTVHLKLRYANFETTTRSATIRPTHDESVVFACVLQLLDRHWDSRRPVRLLGVGLSGFLGPERQLALPFGADQRPAVGAAIDAVRDRFGYDAIRLGAVDTASRWLA